MDGWSYNFDVFRSGFALVQLCCRTTALRASFLHQKLVGAHSTAATRGGGFVGPLHLHHGRGLRTAAGTDTATSSWFGVGRPSVATAAAPGRPTRAFLTAALLLSSSPSTVTGTRFGGGWGGGWRSRDAHTHTAPSMTASSAVAPDAPVERGAEKDGSDDAGVVGAKPPVVFVLGGPGSGKGTQCERLAKEYG